MDFSNNNFHILFYEGLKMLGFDKYLKTNKFYSDIEFNQSTFQRGNQKAFEVVTYFLFSQLKNSDFMKPFRGCYPCLDKTHESDFRKGVISLFKGLEKDPSFNYKFLPGIICNPGGDSFVSLYLVLINYILKKILNIEKLDEMSVEELAIQIEEEKELLMENCKKLKENAIKEEGYCEYFNNKFDLIKKDEDQIKDKLKCLDQELIHKFGTNNTDELLLKTKANFDQIKSHKLMSLFEENEDVLNTEIADIENRVINLGELVNDSSLSPVDINQIQKFFEDKLNNLKQTMDKDNSNVEETIEKLDLKMVYYSSTNRILKDLINGLEKKIDLLKQQSNEKKREFLERGEIQDLIRFVKSKINFNPPKFEFKPEKNVKIKNSSSDLNLTAMDQTLSNRSLEEDFNFSINLAEMTCDYQSNENDESLMQQTFNRHHISQVPNLNNIDE